MTEVKQQWQEILEQSKSEINSFQSYLKANSQSKTFKEQLTKALQVLANEKVVNGIDTSRYDSKHNSQYLVAGALVEYGADIDPDNNNIIWEAAQSGRFNLLDGMLDSVGHYDKELQVKAANKAYLGAASRLNGNILSLLDSKYDIDHSADDYAAWRLANNAIERANNRKNNIEATSNDDNGHGGLSSHYARACNIVNIIGPDILDYLDGIGAKPDWEGAVTTPTPPINQVS